MDAIKLNKVNKGYLTLNNVVLVVILENRVYTYLKPKNHSIKGLCASSNDLKVLCDSLGVEYLGGKNG